MTRSSRIFTVLFAALLVSFVVVNLRATAQQQQIGNAGLVGEARSLTALVGPSSDEVMLSVPPDNNFVLTQVCRSTGGSDYRIHNVGGGGDNSQATLDNTVCQEYTAGLVFYGGDDVKFRNNNASLTVRVLVNGILTKK